MYVCFSKYFFSYFFFRNLSSNDLTSVTDADSLSTRVRRLRALDLSQNAVGCVQAGALWGLKDLRYM